MSSTTATKTIRHLRTLFTQSDLLLELVTDNGPQFCSEEIQRFLASNGIQHMHLAPYHPATNRLMEHFVQTLKNALRVNKFILSRQQKQDNFFLVYRNIPSATIQKSPATLLEAIFAYLLGPVTS